jgi:hypothetical protein
MTDEKIYTEREARNMLLQLAGAGVTFRPHANKDYLMAYKQINGKDHMLVFRQVPMVIPKWYNTAHFWRTHEEPEFELHYKWVKIK